MAGYSSERSKIMNVETIITVAGMLVSGVFVYHRFIISYIEKKVDKENYKEFKEELNKKLDELKEDLKYLREKL